MAIFAVYSLSVNMLLGYTGLLSFGQAMFFGFGGYGTALALTHIPGIGVLPAILLAWGLSMFGFSNLVKYLYPAIGYADVIIGAPVIVPSTSITALRASMAFASSAPFRTTVDTVITGAPAFRVHDRIRTCRNPFTGERPATWSRPDLASRMVSQLSVHSKK